MASSSPESHEKAPAEGALFYTGGHAAPRAPRRAAAANGCSPFCNDGAFRNAYSLAVNYDNGPFLIAGAHYALGAGGHGTAIASPRNDAGDNFAPGNSRTVCRLAVRFVTSGCRPPVARAGAA